MYIQAHETLVFVSNSSSKKMLVLSKIESGGSKNWAGQQNQDSRVASLLGQSWNRLVAELQPAIGELQSASGGAGTG